MEKYHEYTTATVMGSVYSVHHLAGLYQSRHALEGMALKREQDWGEGEDSSTR